MRPHLINYTQYIYTSINQSDLSKERVACTIGSIIATRGAPPKCIYKGYKPLAGFDQTNSRSRMFCMYTLCFGEILLCKFLWRI